MSSSTKQRIAREASKFNPYEIMVLVILITLAICVRLILIDQPFIDLWSYRQSLYAMVAENFYIQGFNILYPQVNVAGSAPGYFGGEFPLVPFIAALLYKLFGIKEWVARIVPVLFFTVSLPYFFLLVKRIYNGQCALFATCAYILTPLSIYLSRSFMPDMPTLSLSIIAIYLFLQWTDNDFRTSLLWGSAFLISLALLIKITSIIIGLPLLYLVLKKFGLRFLLKGKLWGFAAVSLLPSLFWYLHAYFISISKFPYSLWGFHRFDTVTASALLKATVYTINSGLTIFVVVAALIGAIFPKRGDYQYIFHWWLLAAVVLFFLAGNGFLHSPWYGLLAVPAICALAGVFLDLAAGFLKNIMRFKTATLSFFLIFFAFVGYSSYYSVKKNYTPWAAPYRNAGIFIENLSSLDELVVFANVADPTGIYYSHRKGCRFYRPSNSQEAIATLAKLRGEGVRYLAFTHYEFWWLDYYKDLKTYLYTEQKELTKNSEYIVFELKPAKNVNKEGEQCGCTLYGFQCFSSVPPKQRQDSLIYSIFSFLRQKASF